MRKVTVALSFSLAAALACSSPPDERSTSDGSAGAPDVLPMLVSPFPSGLTGILTFESDRQGRPKIYTLDLSNGKLTQITEGPLWRDEHPVWSPDGRQIAFSSNREGNFDIFVMNADGSGITRLTDHPSHEQDPTWARDAKSLFFTAERDGRGELYRVWLDSRKVDRVTTGFDRAIMPSASPDGRYVAYAGQTIRYFQIHVADVSGSEQKGFQVTSGEPACRPAWSPDAKQIAYVLGEDPSRLGLVDVQSRTARTLLKHPSLWLYYPAFSPEGRFVALSVSPEHHRGEDWDLAIVEPGAPDAKLQRLTVGPGNDRFPNWKGTGASKQVSP